ncbi:MAG: multicopper oxidase family protein [Acidiferrobacterales bacterium]|nr:multicopper oxidase family protein [Acidiferrobacterales bacterium]
MFAAGSASVPSLTLASSPVQQLIASPAQVDLVAGLGPPTNVYAYNLEVPGPLLRFRQGDRLRLEVENRLDEPTTVHWHGLRVPVSMDGVSILSQAPIGPGDAFTYEFDLHDAGTFWYHPHINSSQQVGKGLRGVLIVDEQDPPVVDRDLVWVLDDWRLDEEAQIVAFDGNLRDASHNGRIGNAVTVNGSIHDQFQVHPGERIRLRLVNVANARTFAINFSELNPWLIALDGHPIAPYTLDENPIVLGSGQRADLILDVTGDPGQSTPVIDNSYGENFAYELMHLVRSDNKVTSVSDRAPPPRLSANPVAAPDVANAERHRIVFEGGAMGGLAGARLDGEFKGIRDLAGLGKLWATNGAIHSDPHNQPPLLILELGKSYVFDLVNRSAWEHPIHLHGHSFMVMENEAGLEPAGSIRDTVLVNPQSSARIAFVADNPGLWMFHCHILEHQQSGMTSIIAVR